MLDSVCTGRDTAPIEPGTLLARRFRLDRYVGQGWMGTFFRALGTATGQWVAVKVLRQSEPDRVDRFAREARVLADLNRPAIVPHTADGQTQHSEPFLAMKWLEHRSETQSWGQTSRRVAPVQGSGAPACDPLSIHEFSSASGRVALNLGDL